MISTLFNSHSCAIIACRWLLVVVVVVVFVVFVVIVVAV
jgi:hypothetical protein